MMMLMLKLQKGSLANGSIWLPAFRSRPSVRCHLDEDEMMAYVSISTSISVGKATMEIFALQKYVKYKIEKIRIFYQHGDSDSDSDGDGDGDGEEFQ